MGEERSGASGRAVSQCAGGNCIAVESVRPDVVWGPERVKPATPLLLVQQLFRSYDETAETCQQFQPQREGTAKPANRSAR